MYINTISQNNSLLERPGLSQVAEKDPYDLDIQIVSDSIKKGGNLPFNELITSKSLCTPGCGNTGTGNSFCC